VTRGVLARGGGTGETAVGRNGEKHRSQQAVSTGKRQLPAGSLTQLKTAICIIKSNKLSDISRWSLTLPVLTARRREIWEIT
jgi:hypothetical protein